MEQHAPRLTFVPFQDNTLFNLLGLGSGRIITDDNRIRVVYSQDMGNDAMEELLGRDFYLPDNVDVIRINEEMRQANLAMGPLFLMAAFLKFDLPEGYTPQDGVDFRSCPFSECDNTVHHGWLYYGKRPQKEITNLTQGIRILVWAVNNGHITPETAIFLFKKMIKMGLAYTKEDYQRQLEKNHPEVRVARLVIDFLTDLLFPLP
ncbi:MAG: hypothetical protein NTU97_02555 [Candidatus Magasanikbacteria bacterium]|nr:hypothetical protein [Candidatus Magasanikbacteria bacterium]